MCGIPWSVHSLVTGLAVSLHGNSRLATCTRLNSRSTLLLNHLVILCKHCLHSSFLRAVGCPVACLPADVAVSRESTTLILLRATGASLALKTGSFSSRFAAASSSFRLGSSPGVAGSTSLASSRLACSSDCCHCLLARRLHARTWSHTAQQLAKLRATLQETSFAPTLRGASRKPRT